MRVRRPRKARVLDALRRAYARRQRLQRSDQSIARRVAVELAWGLGLYLLVAVPLALLWGLTGPGWMADPPVNLASILQVILTVFAAFSLSTAAWLLLGLDKRDWWFAVILAWPWLLTSGLAFYAGLVGSDVVSIWFATGAIVFAIICFSGPFVGRQIAPAVTAVWSLPLLVIALFLRSEDS